ncbi:MAG: MipA/OmpV family protein [Pseudomonadota bacterium]|jgi:outer membrane protein|nr:MipA/OmpV family protein [Pseudomonadota bacterium]
MLRFAAAALVAASAVLSAAPAFAQDSNDYRVRVGLGVQIAPEYLGSDDHEFGPAFDFSLARGGDPFDFEAPDDSFGISLLDFGGFEAGPALNFERARKDKDVGAPVGKVPATVEAGAFVQYAIGSNFRLRSELRKGIGGHNGLVGNVGADLFWRDGDKFLVSAGPRLLFSNSRYQREYFGVTPEAALATGLPVYRPGGGIHAIGLAASTYAQISGPFGMFGFASYDRLVGDAADSPIVRTFGSRDQLSAGVGLTYTFNIAR